MFKNCFSMEKKIQPVTELYESLLSIFMYCFGSIISDKMHLLFDIKVKCTSMNERIMICMGGSFIFSTLENLNIRLSLHPCLY